jgi:hypothetical protein
LTKVGEREIHEVALSCTRPTPFKELYADYESNPPLTVIAGGGRLFARGFPTNWWIKWMCF